MKPPKILIIYLSLSFPIIIICFTLLGKASIILNGYAINSSGYFYIGKDSEIQVYDNGILKYTINPQTSRSYVFTIDSNDRIILSTSTIVYIMSSKGDVLSKKEDVGTKTFNMLRSRMRLYTAVNGDKYTLVSKLGRFQILRNNTEIVYKMPVLDYVVKMGWWLVFLSLCVMGPIILVKWKRLARK